ncbi:MAG: SDR family NAD(P)-dependent oxidoreductase [SAR324 cluster bacterium]|nr:SDR family NAD(P)-dependent oxidoreductase [SAR324 cluster bacterium]
MKGLERWKGKVALVTGASSGMGKAIACDLADNGMKVVVTARRKERLDELIASLQSQGSTVMALAGDVGKEQDIQNIFSSIRREWGSVDVLVNNAGMGIMNSLENGSTEQWRQTLDVNVMGLSICMREALKDMEGKDDAQIINIGSFYAHLAQVPNFAYYQAAKMAVIGITNSQRAELKAKSSKVKLAMISPGMTATEFREQATGGKIPYEAYFKEFQPLMPEDISQAALYILSTPAHVQVHDILMTPQAMGL